MTAVDTIAVLVVIGIIGLIIQYYIMKAAITASLTKHQRSIPKDHTVQNLLEIIAKGVGNEPDVNNYLQDQRAKEYQIKHRNIVYSNLRQIEKTEKIKELREEYADVVIEA